MTAVVAGPSIGAVRASDMRRFAEIVATIGRHQLRALPRSLRPGDRARAVSAAVADALDELGPTFVKLGQMMTSTSGLFPAPLVEACHRCLDRVSPITAEEVRAIIRADLGDRAEDILDGFDDIPLASASIAQVHGAKLPDGRKVVLKVQRPAIAARMVADIRLMYAGAKFANRFKVAKMANPPAIIENLHAVTVQELDFTVEAERQSAFRTNLAAFGDNHRVTAPEVINDYCGPRVICMERLSGVPIDRVDLSDDVDHEALLRDLLKAWLESICVHGTFHGDLHGGNIWVLDDGRIALLDFGITGDLDAEWQEAVKAMWTTLSGRGDYADLAAAFKKVGVVPADAGDDAEIGALLEQVIAPLLGGSITGRGLGKVMEMAASLFEDYGMQTPAEFVLIMKQILYIEGYCAKVAPGWSYLEDPHLTRNL